MPRKARKNSNTSFFHVIKQGINKEYVFEKDFYKRKYFKMLKDIKEKYCIDIIAYTIMSNHCHLLIHTENIKELSNFMKKVNENYARYYNYMKDRVGYVFRDRFLSEPITDRKYLWQCIAYIHNNPVKAEIVEKCEDYRYSSYTDFIKNTGFINKDIIKMIFGSKKLDIEAYKEMHLKRIKLFKEYEKIVEENMQYIILEIEEKYDMKWEDIVLEKKNIKELVYIVKQRVNISNRELAKYLKADRNKINKIVKNINNN